MAEVIKNQVNGLNKAIMNNEYIPEYFISLYDILTEINVPDVVYNRLRETDILMYNGMQEMAIESLNLFKREMNEKPSVIELKNMKKDVDELSKSIKNNEDSVEKFKNLFVTMNKRPSDIQLLLEVELLLFFPEIRSEVDKNLDAIKKNIDETISIMRFKMVHNRLINESATYESIGDLYKLPTGCLMAIASS